MSTTQQTDARRDGERITKLQAPRGTRDILPTEVRHWQRIEQAVERAARLFGYDEIRTPMFEFSRLFKRGVGEETDIVAKEMYLFHDRGGEEFALRPELTACVVRASVEHSLAAGQAPQTRLYYNSAPMFRYEKPQLGRQRQFHQFGTELLGPSGPLADSETIAFAISVFRSLGITEMTLKINSLGSSAARAKFRRALVEYLSKYVTSLSEESQRRLQTNPLRVLDSKAQNDREIVAGAPTILEFLSAEDAEHQASLENMLSAAGISFIVDPLLVRGLDYYSRSVFEVTSPVLGSQDSLCGGGRYDDLIEKLGGLSTPAVGFAAGVERVVLALEQIDQSAATLSGVYLARLEETSEAELFRLSSILRDSGIPVTYDLRSRSLKAQMKEANRLKSAASLVLPPFSLDGDSLRLIASDAKLSVRDMRTSSEVIIGEGSSPIAVRALVGALQNFRLSSNS